MCNDGLSLRVGREMSVAQQLLIQSQCTCHDIRPQIAQMECCFAGFLREQRHPIRAHLHRPFYSGALVGHGAKLLDWHRIADDLEL